MANFQKPARGNSVGWDEANYRVTVGVGRDVEVWLWGGGPPPEFKDLDVQAGNGALLEVRASGKVGQNLRGFILKGKAAGSTSLRALLTDGRGSFVDYSSPLVVVVTSGAPAASQANRLLFTDVDRCGTSAVDEILERSIREGVEYSGVIFGRGNSFGFTTAVRGEPDSALPNQRVPAGTVVIGTYHTHGNKQGAGEIFSPQDRAFHNLRHWLAYLGTPSGGLLKFLPKDRDPNEHPALAALGGKAITLRAGRSSP